MHLDQESQGIIFEGATITQLQSLFKTDAQSLRRRMAGVPPIGTRGSAVIYDVAEVARKFGSLSEKQVVGAMKRLHPNDLPKLLSKEYWNGQRAKQAFLAGEGDTWSTDKIIEEVSDLVKTLSMELNLLADAVERQHELTDNQRGLIIHLVDAAKKNMVEKVKTRFVKKPGKSTLTKLPVVNDEEEL